MQRIPASTWASDLHLNLWVWPFLVLMRGSSIGIYYLVSINTAFYFQWSLFYQMLMSKYLIILQLNIHKVGLVCRGSLWNLDDMHANSLRLRQINYREAPCHSNIALTLLSNKEIVFIFFECTLPRQFYSLCHHHLYCSTNVHFVVYLLVKEQMKLGIKNKWLFCTQ